MHIGGRISRRQPTVGTLRAGTTARATTRGTRWKAKCPFHARVWAFLGSRFTDSRLTTDAAAFRTAPALANTLCSSSWSCCCCCCCCRTASAGVTWLSRIWTSRWTRLRVTFWRVAIGQRVWPLRPAAPRRRGVRSAALYVGALLSPNVSLSRMVCCSALSRR